MENICGSHPPPQVSLPLFFIAVSKERALNFTEKERGKQTGVNILAEEVLWLKAARVNDD